MSKAFTKDDDGGAELVVVPRAPLPAGLPNYVTPRGLAALLAEQAILEGLRAEIDAADADRVVKLRALGQRLQDLQARITSASLVDPSAQPRNEVRFGARVRHGAAQEHEYQIVGVDEADAAEGRIAFSSPLARALLGKRVGETAELRTPRAEEELTVLHIAYGPGESGPSG